MLNTSKLPVRNHFKNKNASGILQLLVTLHLDADRKKNKSAGLFGFLKFAGLRVWWKADENVFNNEFFHFMITMVFGNKIMSNQYHLADILCFTRGLYSRVELLPFSLTFKIIRIILAVRSLAGSACTFKQH